MQEVGSDEGVTGKRRDKTLAATAVAPEEETELQSADPSTILKGRYVLEQPIGEGGMGAVYKALDLELEKNKDRQPYVALKILRGTFLREFPHAVIALQRESSRTRELGHHNIVRVYNFDKDGDTNFIIMELLQGRSLALILKDRPRGLTLKHTLFLLEQLCAGLAYAHSQRIVHSDLKPGNVFVTSNDTVKILDFGIASPIRNLGQKDPDTVFDPRKLGALSPSHASPEQFERKEADPRDDIYSLGCVAYQMLTGRHPFDGIISPLAMKQNLAVPPVRSLSKQQNQALRDALHFEREKRTRTVEDFFDALNDGRRSPMPSGGWLLAGAIALIFSMGGAAWYVSSQVGLKRSDLARESAQAKPSETARATPVALERSQAVQPPRATPSLEQPATCGITAAGTQFDAMIDRGLAAQTKLRLAADDVASEAAVRDIKEVAQCLQSLSKKGIKSGESEAWLSDVRDVAGSQP